MVAVTALIQVGILLLGTKVNLNLFKLQQDEIKQKKQENYLFSRMIESIKEAMIVCHQGKITFKNFIAEDVLLERAGNHLGIIEPTLDSEDVLTLPLLHIFKEVAEDNSKSSDVLLERPQPPPSSSTEVFSL